MILSEDCQIDKIQMIAKNNNYKFKLVTKIKNWWEVNYLFLIEYQK